MYIPFVSNKPYHKYPCGAVKEGSEVTLRFVLPRSFCCTGARLVIKKDGEEAKKIPMWWDCMQGSDEEWWKVQVTLGDRGLYFYHFEYDTGFGVCGIYRYKAHTGFLSGSGDEWQITVYSKDLKTPDKFKGGIMYQIFRTGLIPRAIKKSECRRTEFCAPTAKTSLIGVRIKTARF